MVQGLSGSGRRNNGQFLRCRPAVLEDKERYNGGGTLMKYGTLLELIKARHSIRKSDNSEVRIYESGNMS